MNLARNGGVAPIRAAIMGLVALSLAAAVLAQPPSASQSLSVRRAQGISALMATAPVRDDGALGGPQILRTSDHFLRGVALGASGVLPVPAALSDPEMVARAFLSKHQYLFTSESGAVQFPTLRVKNAGADSIVRLEQTYAGIPVYGAQIVLQVGDAPNGRGIKFALSHLLHDTTALDSGVLPVAPSVTADQAREAAIAFTAALYSYTSFYLRAEEPTLMIYDPAVTDQSDPAHLVWKTVVTSVISPYIREFFLVDAHTLEVVKHFTLIKTALYREIYDSNNTTADPGTLERSEGQPAANIADVDQCYAYFGDTYNFFFRLFGRDSIDNMGMTLSATVRYCPDPDPFYCPYQNAYWTGARMYFGEGFTVQDVIGHELSHGVTEYESNLIYWGESGAINESMSDVFGELMDITYKDGAADTDTPAVRWLMGEDVPGMGAIRYMADPPAPPYYQPDTYMGRYWQPVTDPTDNGGVHQNSGVGNKLCFLLTDGTPFFAPFNGKTVQAMGTTISAQLFYACDTMFLTQSSDYYDLGLCMYQAANILGLTPRQVDNVLTACVAVAIIPPLTVNAIDPDFSPIIVPVTVTPEDITSQTNGLTQFERIYFGRTMITLDPAPITIDGYVFVAWMTNYDDTQLDTQRIQSFILMRPTVMTAIYRLAPRTLTVNSLNPSSGASIGIDPADRFGYGSDRTPFARSYEYGTRVTVTAPSDIIDSRVFFKWQLNGLEFAGNTQTAIKLAITDDMTLTAFFQPATHTLTLMPLPADAAPFITVNPFDKLGFDSGVAPFNRVYNHGTMVTMTTPDALPPGRIFTKWLRDGADFSGSTSLTTQIFMDYDHAMTPVYKPTPRMVAITSTNPGSGATVDVVPADSNGAVGGLTPCARTYDHGTTISLTASPMAGANLFSKWQRDGADASTKAGYAFVADADTTFTAVYITPAQPYYLLKVTAFDPSCLVTINTTPADYNGDGDGVPSFQRAYPQNTAVTVTAPVSCNIGGLAYAFQEWLLDGNSYSTSVTAQIAMNDHHLLRVVYAAPIPLSGCSLLVASSNPNVGVPIDMQPSDAAHLGPGLTPYTRVFNRSTHTLATLTAPSKAASDRYFHKWLLDGADFSGNSQLAIKVAMGGSHIVTAVYDTRTTCALTVDSADPDKGVAIKVSTADLNGATDGVTGLTRIYDNGAATTLTAPVSAVNNGLTYAFHKWLRNGKDFAGNRFMTVAVPLTEDVTMTAVYCTAWYEDYVIAYSDNVRSHKFRYQKGSPKYEFLPLNDIITSGEGIVLPFTQAGVIGSLSVIPNRLTTLGKTPRAIPQIVTAAGFNRVFVQGTVARRYAGAVQAGVMMKNLTIMGGCANDVRAAELGTVRIVGIPAAASQTSVHTRPLSLAPGNGKQFLTANISLAGVGLKELQAPYQPVRVTAQTKRFGGKTPGIGVAKLGSTSGTLQGAIVQQVLAVGSEVAFDEIISIVPADIAQGFYPRKRDVAILSRMLILDKNYGSNITPREIFSEGNLRVGAVGGDVSPSLPGVANLTAFPARIVAGLKLSLAVSASKAGTGGFIGVHSASADATTGTATTATAIGIISGANDTTGKASDMVILVGPGGVNALFYAGAKNAGVDPYIAPEPIEKGNLALKSNARTATGKITGAASVNPIGALKLAQRLKLMSNVSPDFQINGKKLSLW
ncbi:MAG: M4 family metallopeptidase [Candidatus Sumerlaeota bacterium]|nr:M4 family metallopeptidase [Candidatus Sumerlaeota bacterium]